LRIEPGSFDVVYSVGLVEHFDEPAGVIEQHVRFARPRGITVVSIPGYGVQRYFDPDNLAYVPLNQRAKIGFNMHDRGDTRVGRVEWTS
jgi:2-polyprenyl-3-methyl-5-hydroxy-6-metoxy-1,4-benzoquinol methylase